MKYFPFIYEPDHSIDVYKSTDEYFEKNKDIVERIFTISMVYQAIRDAIPTTMENFWSGHFFPYMESWDELQVSFTLCQFGLYKQAMSSLRSGLELGLLSVYYNINDEGHKTVQKWVNSRDTSDADTPKFSEVWKILIGHPNIQKFQNKIDLKKRIQELGYLHNYVHTKGKKYSNDIGLLKSNFQTFEEEGLMKWLVAFQEIVTLVTTLHMLKYPTTMADLNYEQKFGIDVPGFPHIRTGGLDRIETFLPKEYFSLIKEIATEDSEAIQFKEWIEGLPDITNNQVEEQLINLDKMDIRGGGFQNYTKNQLTMYAATSVEGLPNDVKLRMDKLEIWARENGEYEPKFNIPNRDK
jgi:hypothetical protein